MVISFDVAVISIDVAFVIVLHDDVNCRQKEGGREEERKRSRASARTRAKD